MYPKVVYRVLFVPRFIGAMVCASLVIFLTLPVIIPSAQAKVVVDCSRPADPEFDHSQSPNLEAVIESNELIKQYSVEAQAYLKCMQTQLLDEKDRILDTIKSYRKENEVFRKAYINK